MHRNESFEISKEICQDLKLNIENINEEKFFIKGKTKLSWTKNKFAQIFLIIVKVSGQNSIIEIYYYMTGITGPDTGSLIQPFYKKLLEKTGMSLELETGQIEIKEEDIIKTAEDYFDVSNSNEYTTKYSLLQDSGKIVTQQTPETKLNPQLFVHGSSNLSDMSSTTMMTVEQLKQFISLKHDQYKAQWDKNGIIQFKSECIAILQRMWGQQVQFIIACDQLTKEGYRLMAIDEGKSGGQSSGGFTGGVNAYFYFQKMDYVR